MGWTQRSIPGSARLHLPSSHFRASCGINARYRPAPRLESSTASHFQPCCMVWRALFSLNLLCSTFVVCCLWIILGISVRQKKQHTTICKMAKQQRISSLLTQHRLRFLGYLSRMSEERLLKQLLLSAPVGDKHTAGGQKHQWSDLVAIDLKECNLSRSWREQAQECDS